MIIGFIVIILIAGIFFIANNKDDLKKEDVKDIKAEDIIDKEAELEEAVLEKYKEVPNFTLKDLDGKYVSLHDYRGKIIIVNFWATWCGACDEEMPDLEKVNAENEDVVVLAVNVEEGKEKVKQYIKDGGYTFPVLLDEKGDLAKQYYISAFPTSYFVNEEGILVGAIVGKLTYEDMNQLIDYVRMEFNQE